MTKTEQDIGDFLEVTEDEQKDVDPAAQYNADAGFDIQVVPDGEYVELSTASDDEPLAAGNEPEDGGDGAPLQFLSPNDPEAGLDEEDTV